MVGRNWHISMKLNDWDSMTSTTHQKPMLGYCWSRVADVVSMLGHFWSTGWTNNNPALIQRLVLLGINPLSADDMYLIFYHVFENVCICLEMKSKTLNFALYFSIFFLTHLFLHKLCVLNANLSTNII